MIEYGINWQHLISQISLDFCENWEAREEAGSKPGYSLFIFDQKKI